VGDSWSLVRRETTAFLLFKFRVFVFRSVFVLVIAPVMMGILVIVKTIDFFFDEVVRVDEKILSL